MFPSDVKEVVYIKDDTIVKIDNKIETYDITRNQVSNHKIEKIKVNGLSKKR